MMEEVLLFFGRPTGGRDPVASGRWGLEVWACNLSGDQPSTLERLQWVKSQGHRNKITLSKGH